MNASAVRPAFGGADVTRKLMRRWNNAKPALLRFVCLGLELENRIRTSGNEGVPLQQFRLLDSRKTLERPAPSLLQDVLDLAVGQQIDWSG
ncbi:hypothetical protein CQZ93_16835 [Ochrobactrum vermis]|nr:hypothetical protein CQZ93_16835 [Ochrobactrum vermis]